MWYTGAKGGCAMNIRRILPALLAFVLAVPMWASASVWESGVVQEAPTVEIESAGSTQVVLKEIAGGYGQAQYAWGYTEAAPDTPWTDKRVFIELEPGETYYFFARYASAEGYEASPQSEPVKVVTQTGTTEAPDPGDLSVNGTTKVYDGKPAVIRVSVPEGSNIYYREGDSGRYSLSAFPEYTDVGTYTVGYQVETNGYVDMTGTVTVKITPAEPTITLEDKTVDYTGKVQSMSGAKVTGIHGEEYRTAVVYTYYSDSACTKKVTSPKEAGTYYVVANVLARGNYAAAQSNTARFVIRDAKDASGATEATSAASSGGVTFTITAACGEGGTLTPSGAVTAPKGKNVSFTAKPEKGYVVEDVLIDGKSMGSVGVYTFRNIQEDHTMEVTFRKTVAETTAPTESSTEETTLPTEETTVPPTTEPEVQQKPKKSIPVIIPILMTVLAFGAIGIGVYVYKRNEE